MKIRETSSGQVEITLEEKWEIDLVTSLIGSTSNNIAVDFGMLDNLTNYIDYQHIFTLLDSYARSNRPSFSSLTLTND